MGPVTEVTCDGKVPWANPREQAEPSGICRHFSETAALPWISRAASVTAEDTLRQALSQDCSEQGRAGPARGRWALNTLYCTE